MDLTYKNKQRKGEKYMEMTLRWFGKEADSVTLEQIRQIPGVTGVVTTLYDTMPGEVWPHERIKAMKAEVEAAGLRVAGIESVNIHDSIKVGTPDRDKYIANYITTLERLGQEGIDVVCYNFMPVFDWTRSDLAKVRPDGSTVLSYDQELVDKINPENLLSSMDSKSNGFMLPGWEPERMARIKELFEMYKDVDNEKLFSNLKYFLEAIMPTCEKYNIKMAIHPDDPAWPVFGLPRIMTCKENLLRLVTMVDSPCNGVTLCTGSLGSNMNNDIPDIIRALKGKIHFAHVRNIKHYAPGKFDEAAHLSSDGSLDMYEIMKALYEIGFKGIVRPDHGRAIWGEVAMPGYGLYDRALGVTYLNGILESLQKSIPLK
ncbi:mannonate dehydratase [Clostridium chromiireducens]|uniref:Mannonate dehydratase n=2 Tax=Clostridium chromiireducens TaxID=225345 RepID=A0A1V4IHR8_9CLOT|nr:mannonate dehydratase [Clostridium chromiireducens]